MNLLSVIYVGLSRPFPTRSFNRLSIFNESLVYSITSVMTMFTYHCRDPYMKYLVGWAFISIILLCCMVNFGIMLINFCIKMKLYAKRCKNKYSRKLPIKDVQKSKVPTL